MHTTLIDLRHKWFAFDVFIFGKSLRYGNVLRVGVTGVWKSDITSTMVNVPVREQQVTNAIKQCVCSKQRHGDLNGKELQWALLLIAGRRHPKKKMKKHCYLMLLQRMRQIDALLSEEIGLLQWSFAAAFRCMLQMQKRTSDPWSWSRSLDDLLREAK